jgi:hypothetical protein
MADFITTMKRLLAAITGLPKRFKYFGQGLVAALFGVGQGIWGSFVSLKIGTVSLATAQYEILKLFYKYLVCFFVFMYNLPYCFLTHIIVGIIYILYYLFFELPILIFSKVTGYNLRPHVNELFKVLYAGDDMLYQFTGMHLMRLPPRIVKRCYTCQGKAVTTGTIVKDTNVFTRVGNNITRDFKVKIPQTMRPATRNMEKARTSFKRAFT